MSKATKPLVYVSGPYTKPDPVENTHKALKVASRLYESGLVTPFVPHISLLWHMVDPKPYQFWMDYDMDMLSHCDAILRIPGVSPGADVETFWGLDNDVPIFTEPEGVLIWAEGLKNVSV